MAETGASLAVTAGVEVVGWPVAGVEKREDAMAMVEDSVEEAA